MSSSSPAQQRVVVVGGSTVDIVGILPASVGDFRHGDSIPGKVQYAVGGVGHNIAENLARLGADVWLVSAVGDDIFGSYVREETAASGVNVSGIVSLAGERTGCYLSLLNGEREMFGAVADVAIAQVLHRALDTIAPIIQGASILVVDCNISEEMLLAVLELRADDTPIIADPVSATKALRLRALLPHLSLITPNLLEAEAIVAADIPSTTQRTAEDLSRALRRGGVDEVIVTLGADGVYWSADNAYHRPPAPIQNRRSVTGAGDAFIAGVIYGRLCGYSGVEQLRAGFAAASIAMASERAVNPQMSTDKLAQV